MLVRVKERLLKAIVCGDWIKRACCRMAGEEEFGYFCLSEGLLRWWRGTEERIECFEELACVRCAVDIVVEV